jgi:Asp-tRNA(Asn)/Glu-tRNA(Gln) amidotransferase A subunit family amidase
VHVDRDGARQAARAAEDAVRRGAPLGALHGLPVAIKDDLWVRGMPATTGSLIFSRFVPTRDGTVVRRLREAGAIIIGKTNLPEFASWPRSKSRVGGETRNPWDLTRISGASSGGSGAAVAAGMTPLAIGTDGGGSVRIPAALCGVVGLMPTVGRVPDYGEFLCSPISSAGPMARTVADVALLQQVIAGPDDHVRASLGEPPPELLSGIEQGAKGLRVAWSPDFGCIDVQPGVLKATSAAMSTLGRLGAVVTSVTQTIPHPWGEGEMMTEAYAAAAQWEEPEPATFEGIPDTAFLEAAILECSGESSSYLQAASVRDLIGRHEHLLTPYSRLIARHIQTGSRVPTAEELRAALGTIFREHDVLCTPTMAWVAPRAPEGWGNPYPDTYSGTNFTFIANATGRPAVSAPCGLSEGLPVGLQIIGRPGDEATVLRVARALEKELPPLARRLDEGLRKVES